MFQKIAVGDFMSPSNYANNNNNNSNGIINNLLKKFNFYFRYRKLT